MSYWNRRSTRILPHRVLSYRFEPVKFSDSSFWDASNAPPGWSAAAVRERGWGCASSGFESLRRRCPALQAPGFGGVRKQAYLQKTTLFAGIRLQRDRARAVARGQGIAEGHPQAPAFRGSPHAPLRFVNSADRDAGGVSTPSVSRVESHDAVSSEASCRMVRTAPLDPWVRRGHAGRSEHRRRPASRVGRDDAGGSPAR